MSLWKTLLGGHHGSRHGSYGHGAPSRDSNRPVSEPAVAGVACPACREANANGARFCQNCGTSLRPKACVQCGATMVMNAKFCGQCGTQAP
ncbi:MULTISPECIES: double zinc ribbon domain-containing protein [Hydrogenophaga]|uniref:double zinc ribbon domain-containing protein n=1 Tax=Hydrogenophaga TaxID=47420 RepID=UPI001959A2AE